MALLLGSFAVVMLLSAGGSSSGTEPAPRRCVSLWNASKRGLIDGYHNFHTHGYREAEVFHLGSKGGKARRGACAVAFPSATLDPERVAAVKVQRAGRWRPLGESDGVSELRLSELQAEAIEGANVALGPDGTLKPYD